MTLPSRRERTRSATIDEIKATALALMRQSGSLDVRFADIARAMGMTAPALYRYFADREALLTALIVDGIDGFGARLREAMDGAPADDLEGRVLAAIGAYRAWALEDPQRFALVFGLPVPGFTAAESGPIDRATRAALGTFQEIVRGRVLRPFVAEVHPALAADLGRMAAAHRAAEAAPGAEIPIAGYQSLLHAWAGMHGLASLETFGHLAWLTEAARHELYRSQASLLARAMGAG